MEFSAPVKVALDYEISEDYTVEVKARFTFSLKGACSRCLSDAEQTFTEDAEGIFESCSGDGETYGYKNVIDLNEFLRDSLCFALPPRLLCGECSEPEGENE